MSTDPLDEVKMGKSLRVHVMELGQVFALVAVIIALFVALKHGSTQAIAAWTAGGLLFLAAGRFTPRLMIPVWKGWMKLGEVLERITSAFVLGIMWFGMMVPMGLLLKLVGKRVMDLSFRAPVESYWEERKEALHDFKLLERQY